MRILFQINGKEQLSVALESAAAAHRAGHEVALFLATEAVMAADPEKYLTVGALPGVKPQRTNARWLLDHGVHFYVHREWAEQFGIAGGGSIALATFDQLAVEFANFERVLVF